MINLLFEPPFVGLTRIELFSLTLMVQTSYADIGQSRRFSEGVGHFEGKF